MHRRLFNVMASQVRPGSIQPERQLGPQQSLAQMRHRPAHSIRAREIVSHTQAECKAALSTRDPEQTISLGMQGRPCKLPRGALPFQTNARTDQHHDADATGGCSTKDSLNDGHAWATRLSSGATELKSSRTVMLAGSLPARSDRSGPAAEAQ